MSKIYLNNEELEKVKEMKEQNLAYCKKIFFKKKFNHLHMDNIRDFYEKYCNVRHSDILYQIPFKSSFSFYLYLYLKSQAKPFVPGDTDFSVSRPVDVNFGRIRDMAKITINTVKKSFWELVEVGLLIYSEDMKPQYHNSTKAVMVLNDEIVIGFDKKQNRVIYSIKSEDYNNY